MQRPILRFTLLMFVLVCGSTATLAQGDTVVVCFGDSITNRGYPKILAKTLGVNAINAGVGGNTTSKALRRMQKDVLAHSPDLVVIFFGTNDLRVDNEKVHVPIPKYKANLLEMIQACQKQKAAVILCTLPPIDPGPFYTRHKIELFDAVGGLKNLIKSYQQAAIEVAAAKSIPVVDLQKLLQAETAWMSKDGVHPSEEGNKIIAKHVAKAITKQLSQQ